MNRLLQRFVADQDDQGGSDWVSQRAQEAHTAPFAARAPSPSPPAFEDIPLSSSTTGAKYDTVDLFDDGKKSSPAFPPAPPHPAAAAASEEPVHDFFGNSQPAQDPFGSTAHASHHDPFASSSSQQHSPFASAPDNFQSHSPFGSSSEKQPSPFGSTAGHQHSPFAAAPDQQHSPFGSAVEHHDPFGSAPQQQQDPIGSSTSDPQSSPFGSAPGSHSPFEAAHKQPSPFGSAHASHSSFASAPDQSSPFGSASASHSPFDAAPEQLSPFGSTPAPFESATEQSSPFSAASEHQSSPFGSVSGHQQDPFAAASGGQQSHDAFGATPEAYPQNHEQQYYQGHEQYAQQQYDSNGQQQYDSNGYDYYDQHDQQQYYDQYQQQQYGYDGQYQYSAEEYQYYQAQNGEHTESAASAFGQQEHHQQSYGYEAASVEAEGSAASPAQEEPTPTVDSFFNSSVQPPVSSGSPFDQPTIHSEPVSDPFAQSPAQTTDYFHQQHEQAAFNLEHVAGAVPTAEENQATSEVPVQDFFSSGVSSHADASSLFSSSAATEEVNSESFFGSSHSPAPSPASHHVETPASIMISAPVPVPVAAPVQIEDKTSQLQDSFASFGISSQESENPADHPEEINERTKKPKSRATSTTLDDTIRLAEMYKQMAERLQTEKSDLLKVLADQTDQFYQMQDYIHSLEREVEEYRSKEIGA